MRRSLAWYSAPVSFVHAPSWADFITITSGFRFSVHTGISPSQIELVIPVIGIRLQDTGISGQMGLGMFALAVARVVEHRRRRPRSTKGPVVPHINPGARGQFDNHA